MGHPIWIVPLHTMSQNNTCWLSNKRRWPSWVVPFYFNPIFHTFKIRNLPKYYQIFLNGFEWIWYFQKASKTFLTCKIFNFGTFEGAFQTQHFWTIWNHIKVFFKDKKLISSLVKWFATIKINSWGNSIIYTSSSSSLLSKVILTSIYKIS